MFCGRGLDFFSPLRGTNTLSPVIFFFRLNTLKGAAEASAVDLLRLNTVRSTQTLTPLTAF